MASDCTTFCSTNRDGDTILVDALDQCEHRDETKLDHAHRARVPDVLAIALHAAASGLICNKTLLSVDFPAPLLPSRATISPRATSGLTPLRT